MSKIEIDLSQMVTAEAQAKAEAVARADAIKAECRALILSVADETAQMNLNAAAAGGLLSEADMTTYRAALGWISAMRSVCGERIAGKETAWPTAPAKVEALAARF